MRMFKHLLWVLGIFGLAVSAFAGGKTVTQKYEVVCMKCVAHSASMGKDGGHGAGHAACAMKCAMNGTNMGLIDEKGNLYIPIDSNFKSASGMVKDKAGQTVELTGTIIKTKGVMYLQLAASDDKMDMNKDGKMDKTNTKTDDGDGDKD